MKKRLLRSLTVRLTLHFALIAVVVLLVLGMVVSYFTNAHFIEQDQHDLNTQLSSIRQTLRAANTPEQLGESIRDINLNGMVAIITTSDDHIRFSSPNIAPPKEQLQPNNNAVNAPPFTWEDNTGIYRGIQSTIHLDNSSMPSVQVLLGMDISHHQSFLESLRYSIWGSTVIAALLMGYLGWLAVVSGLRPIKELINSASQVTAQKLSTRLPVDPVPIELQGLVQTLNLMLERLEDSFKRLSEFSSDLAHELRTPLSHLKTQTQVILSRDRSIEEYREALYSNSEELNQLSEIVTSMLFLAQADNGLIVPNQEQIKLHEEVENLFEFYEAYAEDRHILLETTGAASVSGDKMMIRRALNNLLSNAIKYGQEKSTVFVSIETLPSHQVRIAINNDGQTIDETHLPHLFDRFYRVDRSRQSAGTEHTINSVGLGLAITSSIIKSHGGSIYATSANNKTSFVIELPAFGSEGSEV